MGKNEAKIKSVAGTLVLIALLGGCVIYVGSSNQSHKFTKIVHMPVMSLSQGSDFQTQTHNGQINVSGTDVNECNVTATIRGYASSMQRAEEIVEKTKLRFERSTNGLTLNIDRPENLINCSVSVDIEMTLPKKVNLELVSHNGQIKIDNISGNTNAVTHNGQVSVNNISGITILRTHNGQIDAEEISGDIDFVSHNGRVKAEFSEAAEPDCDIAMVTHNGGIELTTPRNYSAKVSVSTHNGAINTELPLTVSGEFSDKSLTGTIGDGQGDMKLETYNGSIKIR